MGSVSSLSTTHLFAAQLTWIALESVARPHAPPRERPSPQALALAYTWDTPPAWTPFPSYRHRSDGTRGTIPGNQIIQMSQNILQTKYA